LANFGNIFLPLEHLLDVALLAVLVVPWIQRRRQARG